MSAIRKLAAILATDMAGYSRLMGADEAGTAQALREHRSVADPLVAEHGGRIVKTTGDGVLIEFGSLVGAVECARRSNVWQPSGMPGSLVSAAWNGASAFTSATSWLKATTSSATGSTSQHASKVSL